MFTHPVYECGFRCIESTYVGLYLSMDTNVITSKAQHKTGNKREVQKKLLTEHTSLIHLKLLIHVIKLYIVTSSEIELKF